MKIFLYSSSVYYCHLFLISSAPVRSIPFLSFIVPIFHLLAMKCLVGPNSTSWWVHLFIGTGQQPKTSPTTSMPAGSRLVAGWSLQNISLSLWPRYFNSSEAVTSSQAQTRSHDRAPTSAGSGPFPFIPVPTFTHQLPFSGLTQTYIHPVNASQSFCRTMQVVFQMLTFLWVWNF